jgi:hypothetical protein
MIKHLVFWKLKDRPHGLSKEECIHVIQTRMHALRGKIPGLLAIEVGADVSCNANSSDLALYSEFENAQALAVYQAHPLHQAIVPYVAEAATERRVVDYEA